MPRIIATGGYSELAILEVTWWLLLLAYEVAGFSGNYSALATACTVIKVMIKSLRGSYTCCVPGCYNSSYRKYI